MLTCVGKKNFLGKEKFAGVAADAAAQPTWSTISWYQNLVETRRAPLNCSRTLLYTSIRVRTAPSVSVRVRVRVSVSFSVTPLRILLCMCPGEYS